MQVKGLHGNTYTHLHKNNFTQLHVTQHIHEQLQTDRWKSNFRTN